MIVMLLLILCALILAFIVWMYCENRILTVTKYEVRSKKVPENADGMKFVVLADLHSNQFGQDNVNLIRRIDELSPDFIVIAGDLFIGKQYNFDIAYHLLERLSKQYTIYYSYGNHEQNVEMYELTHASCDWKIHKASKNKKALKNKEIQTFADYKEKVEQLGVHLLDNSEAVIEKGNNGEISILGGTIDLKYFKRLIRPEMTCEYLNSCFGTCQKEQFQILIAHNPMYFPNYAKWGADLVLAGHVHGGMVRLPKLGGIISPQMQFFPRYDAGQFTIEGNDCKSQMIVSRGLGIHTLKIRVFNRPELVMVTLKREEKL